MKLITVQFDDSVDITTITIGTKPITVSDGATNITGGTLMSQTEMIEPELVPHTHVVVTSVPVDTTTGPAIP